jgi:hypothetical protein
VSVSLAQGRNRNREDGGMSTGITEDRPILFPKEPRERRSVRAQKVATFLSGLDPNRAWELIVRPFKRTRSTQQNRYERGVCCVLLSKAVGYEPDEIHEWLLGAYFGWKQKAVPKTPNNPRGIEDVPVRTTTRNELGKRDVLNREQYSDFIAFVQRFGAKHGVFIPDPDPEWYLHEDHKAA